LSIDNRDAAVFGIQARAAERMSHGMGADRRPVSQLHSADDLPDLMRRAMRALVRAEELTKDLARASDAERDALRAGWLVLVRRYAVHLRDAGESEARVADRLREELNDSLIPFNLRHSRAMLFEQAERCVAEVFASGPTQSVSGAAPP
jgi:hypothetical protein